MHLLNLIVFLRPQRTIILARRINTIASDIDSLIWWRDTFQPAIFLNNKEYFTKGLQGNILLEFDKTAAASLAQYQYCPWKLSYAFLSLSL